MESDEDVELLPSSPIILPQPKLKRLKKAAVRVPNLSPPKSPDHHASPSNNSSQELPSLHSDSPLEDLTFGSVPNPESLSAPPKEHGSGAARVLDFDSVGDELDGNVVASQMEKDKVVEVADLKRHELERKRPSLDSSAESEEKKKKKKRMDVDGAEKMARESASNKRKAEKERRENLKQLRAESQRLLRETRDAAFKPIPLVQKPISSILDKIRQRKLEILNKSSSSYVDNDTDDGSEHCLDEEIIDKVEEIELEVTPTCSAPSNNEEIIDKVEEAKLEVTPTCPVPTNNEEIIDKVEEAKLEVTPTCPVPTNSGFSTPHLDGSKDALDNLSCESIPSPLETGSESDHTFRAPIGDTQELYSDSERSDVKDEAVNENPNNPSKEVSEPSMFAMNLQFDSAPPDDDVSSDDEDNDKENVDPHLHGSVQLSSSPSGDPVKAFVDEEAEEEDDSDNDIQHFQDNEEVEGDDDIEDLNDLIATEFEEKPTDREKRDQLHQQWLEQQDTAGMDNILQKFNCGSKLKESTSFEDEEDEESKETENEFDDEAEDYIAPSDSVKINLKKVKQMIPQMFTDKDDAYVSSDDDETEMRLAKQCLFDKAEEKATFLSPAEDESSKEVFSRIKKLNTVPDTKRNGRTSSAIDMLRIGQSINISSKSSFVGRASNHFMPSSHKNGSSKARSFIFERDDSNSRTSISMSDDSSDMIQRESQVPKTFSAKFQRNTQNKYTALDSASQTSSVSLLEILRKSSIHAKHSVQHAEAQQKESVFDAFKLAKKPTRTDARV